MLASGLYSNQNETSHESVVNKTTSNSTEEAEIVVKGEHSESKNETTKEGTNSTVPHKHANNSTDPKKNQTDSDTEDPQPPKHSCEPEDQDCLEKES